MVRLNPQKRPLDGKRALVTGGGTRLGKAIALALGEAGADVAVHHHTSVAGALQAVGEIEASGRGAFAVRADLTLSDEVERMFKQVDARFGGPLDILVNSAGVMEKIPLQEITPIRWARMFQVNVESALLCAQAARPRMLEAGTGTIVNITDISAERPWKGYAHYCASKAALLSLTRSLAVEWAPEIRVNAVAPGAVLPPEQMTQAQLEALASAIPMQRLGDPSDVARTVVFLSAGPEFITGQVIAVDGGRSIRG